MGIKNYGVDASARHTIQLEGGGFITLKHVSQNQIFKYSQGKMPAVDPDATELTEEVERMSVKLTVGFLVDEAVEEWVDEAWPDGFDRELAKTLLIQPEFESLLNRIHGASLLADNFRMSKEIFAKKLSAATQDKKKSGE